MKQFVTIAK